MDILKEYFQQLKLRMVEMRAEKSHWKDLVILIQAKKGHKTLIHRKKIHILMKIKMQTSYLKSLVKAKKLRV